ncbi:hypothetical protein [Olsenella intestinalis]|uniref:hypothetical protein n=1 Tax=Olsenella intestinalis TaxID=2930083 RepID=UPI00200BDE6B|nr:hypothetical protein [Olsenella intestinalis]
MKQLTCEMCGGTDLMKDGGVFICQSCGCKYTVEEAKKMMVEGTVDVTGTVKVDNSEFVQRYLANARRAKEKEDWEETEKYYNLVEQNDPNNIEAIFYSAYGKAKASLVDGDIYKRESAFNVLSNCISIIDDHYKPERQDENREAIMSMADDLAEMLCSGFVFSEWKNGYGVVVRDNKSDTYALFVDLIVQFAKSIENIKQVDDHPYLHEALIGLFSSALNRDYLDFSQKNLLRDWIKDEQRELAVLQEKQAKEYWAEHPVEKANLKKKKSELNEQLLALKTEEGQLPGMEEKEASVVCVTRG